MTYNAPIKDILFTLEEVAAIGGLKAEGGYAELTDDLIESVLSEAGRFATEVLGPLNRVGDKHGASLKDGVVTASPGFKEAFRAFASGGWLGLSADPDFGGAGMPHVMAAAVSEMINGSNLAFGLAPILAYGAMDAVSAHADENLKQRYLHKMVSGEWLATMNLTEPQAGSDVGALKTRAIPQADGTYRLFGTKMFITWGEHDLTDNIIHLVLARTPDAPEGSRGISLFLVPKVLVDEHGNLTSRNDLKCASIEHKLGINASPTCVMNFGEGDGAVGYLVGRENKGLAAMFTMMNSARLLVGIQGVGVAECAYQKALAYARDRRQGSAEGADGYPARIVDHPDIRRTLWLMKAKVEAARAVCYMTAMATDESLASDAAEDRAFAKRREELLTPIAKSWSSDIGVEVSSAAVQVHGGMGFVEDTGIAQLYRDVRITPIYEGTNGIQAIDLLTRKLKLEGGLAFQELIADIRQTIEDCEASSNSDIVSVGVRLKQATDAAEQGAAWLVSALDIDRRAALAGATVYQTLLAEVCGGWALAISAIAAVRRLKDGDGDKAFLKGKIVGARVYAESLLSAVAGRVDSVRLGSALIFGVDENALTSA